MTTQAKSNIAQLPVPAMQSGGKLQPIVPTTWQDAVSMAGAFVRAGMVPKHFEGADDKGLGVGVGIEAELDLAATPGQHCEVWYQWLSALGATPRPDATNADTEYPCLTGCGCFLLAFNNNNLARAQCI